jgi:hypothetical protein
MRTDTSVEGPYRPNFIHSFYDWLDRLPIPGWLFLVLLIPIIGLAQHAVGWTRGLLTPGQFNWALGYAGSNLTGILLPFTYVIKGAPRALDQFRPLLAVTEEEYARLKYQFVTIPSGLGTLFFLIGAAMGAISGFSAMAVAPAVDYAFPQMRLGIWIITSGVFFLFGYQVIRQLRQIGAFYAMPERLDLFNPSPLYGFSRYTATIGMILIVVIVLGALLDPTAYETPVVLFSVFASIVPLVLVVFYLPLSGAHRRLASEKEHLLQEVKGRIETILDRIDAAAFKRQDYGEIAGMRTVFSTMREKKETVEGLSTWPWRPGTFTGLLSAIFLPVVLILIREIISGLFGS